MTVLWTTDEIAKAMRAVKQGALPDGISGLSIDTKAMRATGMSSSCRR
jgi:UDP-N-acetylmuramoyl-tripeptide--D-alanyl-D-alanine ligase